MPIDVLPRHELRVVRPAPVSLLELLRQFERRGAVPGPDAAVQAQGARWPVAQLGRERVRRDVGRVRRAGEAAHRVEDRAVARAAAEVAREQVLDGLLGRLLVLAQMRVGRHDESRAAVAALRAVAVGQALLHGVEAVAAVADPLDGRDRHAVDRGHRSQARVDRAAHDPRAGSVPARQHDRAGAAAALAAAELRPRQAARSQVVDEQERRVGITERDAGPVDVEDDLGARRLGRRRRVRGFGSECHRAIPSGVRGARRPRRPRTSNWAIMPPSSWMRL